MRDVASTPSVTTLVVMADLCLDEFTDHGHCGVLDADGRVDNDATLERYAAMAAGAGRRRRPRGRPRGMMDGQVARDPRRARRRRLRGRRDPGLRREVRLRASTARSARRSSSTLQGDRRTYQQDPANAAEALREVALDVAEGADIVMVKPALGYLDVVCRGARRGRRAGRGLPGVGGVRRWSRRPPPSGWIDREPRDPRVAHRRSGGPAPTWSSPTGPPRSPALLRLDPAVPGTTSSSPRQGRRVTGCARPYEPDEAVAVADERRPLRCSRSSVASAP